MDKSNPCEVFNQFISDSVLIFDCSSVPAAESYLLPGAVPLDPAKPLLDAALAAHQYAMDEFCPDNRTVAIVFQDSLDPARGTQFAQWLKANRCSKVLRVDRAEFEKMYPFLLSVNCSELPSYPAAILDGQLYLGPAASARELPCQHLGITHIVSLLDRQMVAPEGCEHLLCNIRDCSTAVLAPVLAQALPFITQALSAGGRVLVHCEMGASRSASVVAAYLMEAGNLNSKDALQFIKDRRPCINPNEGFRRQLNQGTKRDRQLESLTPDQSAHWLVRNYSEACNTP